VIATTLAKCKPFFLHFWPVAFFASPRQYFSEAPHWFSATASQKVSVYPPKNVMSSGRQLALFPLTPFGVVMRAHPVLALAILLVFGCAMVHSTPPFWPPLF